MEKTNVCICMLTAGEKNTVEAICCCSVIQRPYDAAPTCFDCPENLDHLGDTPGRCRVAVALLSRNSDSGRRPSPGNGRK
ncbi:hypothetical protein J2S38_005052 [Mycolicibacterium senegalense]|nr:hypothetical protein [Mycolicibacterium senegalense]